MVMKQKVLVWRRSNWGRSGPRKPISETKVKITTVPKDQPRKLTFIELFLLVKTPKLKNYGHNPSGLQTSGLASSLSFTPVQGIELIDPTAAAERVKKANEKYFGDGAFSIVRK